MILLARGSCSPHSLGRRLVKVGVRVRVVKVIVGGGSSGGVGVVLLVLILVLVLVLLLWVLLLGAPRRTMIRRHLVGGGDVLLGGLVGKQVVLARLWASWKLDGVV